MKDKLFNSIQKKPLFLLLLPLFFVFHSLVEIFHPVLIKEAITLYFIYSGSAIFIAVLFYLLYRNVLKASLASFMLMSGNFFLGSLYEFFKKNIGGSIITKFSFFLPAIGILIIILLILIKKSNRKFFTTVKYLNILFLLLILIDTGILASKIITKRKGNVTDLSEKLSVCDTCAKPDIYLVIADGYAGKQELQEMLSFDNSPFENELDKRGFYIVENSKSNYNKTAYSMASLLNMDYIKNMEAPGKVNHPDMLTCQTLIKNNNLINFLKKSGYQSHNISPFDLSNIKKPIHNLYFPTYRSLLSSQTLINRINFYLGFHFAPKKERLKLKNNNYANNIKIDSLAREILIKENTQPRFVYIHYNMPHHPYLFNSKGLEVLTDTIKNDLTAYIEYLQYGNKKFLELIDSIKSKSATPPVILLLGDHGFREFPGSVDKKYYFMNLNAVYLPSENYNGFYSGMSNVNQFRVILNKLFGQHLPLLKDSTIFETE